MFENSFANKIGYYAKLIKKHDDKNNGDMTAVIESCVEIQPYF